jgi:hypothetical protein
MENLNQQMPEMEDMTPEQIAERKAEMLAFYTDSLPYLQAQFEYESVLSRIDEVRFKRANIQMQFAMMMNGSKEQEETDEPETTDSPNAPKERKLKKS